jgi:hypothetical protein
MFFELALNDIFLIWSIVVLFVSLFYMIFVFKTKMFPSKQRMIDLNEKGVLIITGLFLIIFILSISFIIIRVKKIDYFIRYGIHATAYIQEVKIEKKRELRFSYTYNLQDEMYSGNAKIYNKNIISEYKEGTEILILIDPKKPYNSLFVH